MAKRYREAKECPITKSISIIGGKWKPIILWVLRKGPLRFGELNREIEGISEKVLSEQLTELEDEGVITRRVYYQKPPKVEYSLSELGTSFTPVLEELAEWSRKKL
ncbi:MAG: helix-turn-helix domain-containing protein [Balneolaceae bacterium]|nr:helix-turn-helix domain-containing protein [Balneolaceae bacterium]